MEAIRRSDEDVCGNRLQKRRTLPTTSVSTASTPSRSSWRLRRYGPPLFPPPLTPLAHILAPRQEFSIEIPDKDADTIHSGMSPPPAPNIPHIY